MSIEATGINAAKTGFSAATRKVEEAASSSAASGLEKDTLDISKNATAQKPAKGVWGRIKNAFTQIWNWLKRLFSSKKTPKPAEESKPQVINSTPDSPVQEAVEHKAKLASSVKKPATPVKKKVKQSETASDTKSSDHESSKPREASKPKPWWNEGLYMPFSLEAKRLKLEEVEAFLKDHPKFFEEKDSRHGISNMHYAARDNSDPRVFEALLSKAPPKTIDVTTTDGSTLLHFAVQNKNPKIASILLLKKPDLIKQTGFLGTSAIETAAGNAPNAKVIEYLLRVPGSTDVLKGVGNVWRSVDNGPSGALHRALENSKLSDEDCIKMIRLLAKADPRMLNAENSAELTPFEFAKKNLSPGKRDKVVKALQALEQETGHPIAKTPWWKKSSTYIPKDITSQFSSYADKLKHDELEAFLTDYPGFYRQKGGYGIPNLHYLAQKNRDPKILEDILTKDPGCIDIISKNGENLLHMAAQNPNPEMTKFILSKKPELIRELTKQGRSVFHYAAKSGNPEALKCLLEHDSASEMLTGLIDSVRNPRPELDEAFEAEAFAPGNTPLHEVIEKSSSVTPEKLTEMIHLLLQKDPSMLDVKDVSGKTALQLAEKISDEKKKQALIKALQSYPTPAPSPKP